MGVNMKNTKWIRRVLAVLLALVVLAGKGGDRNSGGQRVAGLHIGYLHENFCHLF